MIIKKVYKLILVFLFLLFIITPAYAEFSESLQEKVVYGWEFNEDSGTPVGIRGRLNITTVANTPTQGVTGKLDKAISYHALSSEYVEVSSFNIADMTGINGAYSVTAWVRPDFEDNEVANRYTVVRQRYDGSNNYHLIYAYGKWSAKMDGQNIKEISYNADFTKGDWVFLAMTYDGNGNGKLYVNSVEENSTSGLLDMSGTSNMVIGAQQNYILPWNGTIDQVIFYNVSLSGTDISNIYNSGSGLEVFGAGSPPAGNLTLTAPNSESPNSNYQIEIQNPNANNIINISVYNTTNNMYFETLNNESTEFNVTIPLNYSWGLGTYTTKVISNETEETTTFDIINNNPLLSVSGIDAFGLYNENQQQLNISIQTTDTQIKTITITAQNSTTTTTELNQQPQNAGTTTYYFDYDLSEFTEGEFYYINISVVDFYGGVNESFYNVSVDFTPPTFNSLYYSTSPQRFNFYDIYDNAGSETVEIFFNVSDNLDNALNCTISYFEQTTNLNATASAVESATHAILNDTGSCSDVQQKIKTRILESKENIYLTCSDRANNTATTTGLIDYDILFINMREEKLTSEAELTNERIKQNSNTIDAKLVNNSVISIDIIPLANDFKNNAGIDSNCDGGTARYGWIYFNTSIKTVRWNHQDDYFRTQVSPTITQDHSYLMYGVNLTDYSMYELIVSVNQELYNKPVIIKRYIAGEEITINSDYPTGVDNRINAYLIANQQYNIYVLGDNNNLLLTDTISLTSPQSISVDVPSFDYNILNMKDEFTQFYGVANETDNETYTLYLTSQATGAITATIKNETGYTLVSTSQTDNLAVTQTINISEMGDAFTAEVCFTSGTCKKYYTTLPNNLMGFGSVIFMSIMILIFALSMLGTFFKSLFGFGAIISSTLILVVNWAFTLHPVLTYIGWGLLLIGIMGVIFGNK